MTFGIESSNIVGYTTKEAEKGKFLILGAQFEGVAGGTKINDLISGVQGVDFDWDLAFQKTAAQVQIPNASGSLTTYYYLNDGSYDDGTEEGGIKAGWCDGDGFIVDAEVTPGEAFWFKSVPGDAIPTIAGAVSEENVKSIDCPKGFSLRANAFPMTVALNSSNIGSDDIVGVDFDWDLAFQNTATQVQIPNASGSLTTYYYLNDGSYDDSTEEGGIKAGWCDGDGFIVDAIIPAMQGFWTKGTSGAFTLKFTK